MSEVNFTDSSNVAIFPSDGDVVTLPSSVELLKSSTTVKISGSDFIMQFEGGQSLTLLFGGIFTSVGNNLTIQDSRGNRVDLVELISSYETVISNNVLLQPIDAMSLNQLLEKIPDGEGQEIASGAAQFGEGGIAQGSAPEGDEDKATGLEGKSENEQEEKEFKLTTDQETDDEVEKVTGSGSSEQGGLDDLQDTSNQFDSREDKTQDFMQSINELTSTENFTGADDSVDVGPNQAKPQAAGGVADSEAIVQTTLALAATSDSGSSTSDLITNATTLTVGGVSTNGAIIAIFSRSDFDPNLAIQIATPIVTVTVPTGTTANEWEATIPDTAVATDGIFQFVAVPTAAGGAAGTASAPLSVTIDRSIEAPTITLATASQGEFVSSTTTDSTFDLTGTAEAGSVITLNIDNAALTTTVPIVANSAGQWSFTVETALAEGPHAIVATATDIAGNTASAESFSVTVDTTPPTAPVITNITANNTGGIAGTGFVGDSTPVINGTSTVGSRIIVSIDGTAQTAFEVTNTDGSWSFEVPAALAEGSHTFSAIAADGAGNRSPVSNEITTIVANPSTQLTINLDASSDSGRVGDLITNQIDNTVLTGTGAVGETLIINNGTGANATQLGTVIVGDDSTWSLTVATPLVQGLQTFSAVRSATSQSASIEVNVDTVIGNPTVSISGANLVQGLFYISATSSANAIGTLDIITKSFSTLSISVNGTTIATTSTADANGRATIDLSTLNLNTGANADNAIEVTATDLAGNTASSAVTLTVNPPAVATPTIALSNSDMTGGDSNPTFTNNSDVTVTGVTSANTTVQIYSVVGETSTLIAQVQSDANGQYSGPASLLPLPSGAHMVRVDATNLAGDIANNTFTFNVDLTPPAAPTLELDSNDDSGANDNVTNVTTTTINGSGSTDGDVITVFVNNVQFAPANPIIANASGNWSVDVALNEGANTVTASATDRAGNVGTVSPSLGITVDTAITIPTMQLAASSQGLFDVSHTPQTQFTLQGTAEANSTLNVAITLNGIQVQQFTTAVDSSGNWSQQLAAPGLVSGNYVITATATDLAGNNASSLPFNMTVDLVAPTMPVLANISIPSADAMNQTNDPTPLITGSGLEAGARVEVSLVQASGNTVFTPVIVDATGNWQFNIPNVLTNGQQSIEVVQIDLAGNRSPATTVPFSVTAPDVSGTLTIGLQADAASDSGTIGDALTNQTTVTLVGNATPNETVSIYRGDTLLGTAAVNVTGQWSLTGVTLQNGSQELAVVRGTALPSAATADNVARQSIVLDAAVTRLDAVITDGSGNVATIAPDGSYHISAIGNNTLQVTTEAFSTVRITLGPNLVQATTADIAGIVTLPLSSIQSSISNTATGNTFNIEVTDPAGNTLNNINTPLVLIFDNVAPTIPTVALATADMTGTSATQTNNDSFNIVGQTEAGVSVQVFFSITNNNGTVVGTPVEVSAGTTIADASGNFTASFPAGITPIAAGQTAIVNIRVVATDIAGNTISSDTPFTIDRLTPDAPTVDLPTDQDTGTNQADGITSNTDLILNGTAEAGSVVTLSRDGTQIATITTDPNGTWSTPVATLATGSFVFTATATDAAGNVSTASAATTIQVDTNTVDPTLTLVQPAVFSTITMGLIAANTTNALPFTINGTAEMGAIVAVTFTGINGFTETIMSSAVAADGSWSVVSPATIIASGQYNITATATDIAGNAATTNQALTVTVDLDAPAASTLVVATSGNGTFTDGNTPAISGTATAGDYVVLVIDGVNQTPILIPTGGAWSFQLPASSPLGEGSHTFSAFTFDTAGNRSDMTTTPDPSITLNVDTVAPTISNIEFMSNTSNALSSNDNTITIQGTVSGTETDRSGFSVQIFQDSIAIGNANVIANGTWSFTIPVGTLADANYIFDATVTDLAGNTSVRSSAITLTRDTVYSPTASIVLDGSSQTSVLVDSMLRSSIDTNDSTPVLRGSAEVGSMVNISIVDSVNASVFSATPTVSSAGTWSVNLDGSTALADGNYTATVSSTDAAGNPSTQTLAFIVDTTIPNAGNAFAITTANTAAFSTGTTILANSPTPTFTGTADANTFIVARNGLGAILGEVAVDSSGNWSLTTSSLPSASGAMGATTTITFQNVDAAGNVATATQTATVNINTTPITDSPGTVDLAMNDTSATVNGLDFTTNNSNPMLTGTLSNSAQLIGTTGLQLILRIDNQELDISSLVTQATGAWVIDLSTFPSGSSSPITDGNHDVRVFLQDSFGNTSTTTTAYSYTVDTSPPASPINFSVTGGTMGQLVAFSGDVAAQEAGATIQVSFSLNNGPSTLISTTTTAGSDGSWTLTPSTTLVDGSYTFTATATDLAGNTSNPTSSPLPLLIDNVANVAITSPALTNPAGANNFDLTGTSEAGATSVTVSVGGASPINATVDAAGNWNATLTTLANGSNSISVSATDASGNVDTATQTLVVDAIAPAAPVVGMIGNTTVGASGAIGGALSVSSGMISGTVTDNDIASIQITYPDNNGFVQTVNVQGTTWSATLLTTPGSQQSIEIIAIDSAGNQGTAVTTLTFTSASRIVQLDPKLFESDNTPEPVERDDLDIQQSMSNLENSI